MPHPTGGYKNKLGQKVPGVTTIGNRFKDSGGLIIWAWTRGRDFPNEELYATRDKAAELGTIVHAMVQEYVELETTMIHGFDLSQEDQDKVMSAFDAFQEWFEMNRFEVLAQEESLVSEQYQFGGTFDAVARDGKGRIVLLDWKTSDGVWPEMLVQLAAYRILWNENHPDLPLTGGSHLCRFAKANGDFAHHYYPDLSDAERQFILLREAYDLDKLLKKRAA